MNAFQTRARDAAGGEMADLIGRAADALRRGGLVVMPTETVYGLAVDARSEEGVRRLIGLTGGHADAPLAWHAPTAGEVRELLAPAHAAHRRLLRRLLPGPVTFVFEAPAETADRVRASLRPAPDAVIAGADVTVRVPDHPIASAVLAGAGVPVAARSIAAAGWGQGMALPEGLAARIAGEVDVVIDDGPTRLGRPSTVVRLGAGGGVAVTSIGALEERQVRRHLERTILFVCTGNTCRSPMAAALARDLVSRRPADGVTTKVRSAGTFAAGGAGATPEAVEAVRKLGVEMGRHASTELTRELIAEAEAILTMTREHADAVAAMDPGSRGKVMTLDPTGRAVPDPIGSSQDVYDRAAEQIRDLVAARLKELEP